MNRVSDLKLRNWVESDRARLFEWRNRPEIVALGTSQRTVSWEEHCAWFSGFADEERRWLRIIEIEGNALGSVRLERDGALAEITIYIHAEATGRGYGVRVIRQACDEASRRWPELRSVQAHIRIDNRASLIAFQRAGFRKTAIESNLQVLIWQPPVPGGAE